MSDQQETRLGQQIGEYRLMSKLGGGGFGTVYLAEHVHEHTQAAVKVLDIRLTKSEDFKDFVNEARTMRLRHPHIVPLLDFGISRDDLPFLVMEYAPKGTLRDRHPKGERIPLLTIVSYIDQLASALQYAHDHRVIHRDIKPENILVRADGTLMVSDFGIAKLLEQSVLLSMQTQVGTPVYMAPEQYMGHPCFASDQYALAVVVYEWICGVRPFQGPAIGLAVQHMTVPPPSLRDHLPKLSEAADQVIQKALAKAPEDRFKHIQAFADALYEAIPSLPNTTVLSTPLETKNTASSIPTAQISQQASNQKLDAKSRYATTRSLPEELPQNNPDENLPSGLHTVKKQPSSRRIFLMGAGVVIAGGIGVGLVISPLSPKTPVPLTTKNVNNSSYQAQRELLTSLNSLENFPLQGAIDAARLTRTAYDVFVSPIIKFGTVITGDYLTGMLNSIKLARNWLAGINKDNVTLAVIQKVFESWVQQVQNLPKQLDAITDTDLDGAQAYLHALQQKITDNINALNAPTSTTNRDNTTNQSPEQARHALLVSIENIENFTLQGAIDAARLTRTAYDVFVSPIIKFGSAVTDDYLTGMFNALKVARNWLAGINQDNATLAAIQNILQSWVDNVQNLPKQLNAITDTDLDSAQAYLHALQRKIAGEINALNITPSPHET